MDRLTLLAEIDAVKRRHGIRDTALGLAAVNDGHFVHRLRDGKNCRPRTAQKVLDFITYLNAFQTVRTEDGTVIAYDPVSGVSASGRTLSEALAELRRLLSGPVAA